MTHPHQSEALLAKRLRAAELEIARLKLAIARAATYLPGRPEAAEAILSKAMEDCNE